ncbi:MAG: helix-turn-helix transcriptional regulator [Selenomonadaceae bacterium]|nr:helix-turn-helix transcriptional regulator [Selenomonadaceae bacterium]
MTVTETFKKFRAEQGLSQADVAEKLLIFPQAYSRYENGKYLPDIPIIIKIANTFDVSADYLLGLRDTLKTNEVGAAEVQERGNSKRR